MAFPGTITSLRYAQRNRLSSEHKLTNNYFRELIHYYGIDAVYFRHDSTPYTTPSGLNFDYIYGEQPTMTYWLSSNVIIYINATGDDFIMNKFGIESNTDTEAFILIEDFTEQFRDLIGEDASGYYEVELSGYIASGAGYIRSDDIINETDYLSGYTSGYIDNLLTSGYISGVYDESFIRYPKKYHDLIYKSRTYDTRLVNGNILGTWEGYLDENLNGTISGTANGNLYYKSQNSSIDGGPLWKIAPKVGDFFRIDFNDDNHEEYEITQIMDRDLKSQLNQLLSKYVWRMNCVRRDPSYEDVVGASNTFRPDIIVTGGTSEEEFTRSRSDENVWTENASNIIHNYETTSVDNIDLLDVDDVYGDYSM